jgi:hypothetical protein
LGTALLTDKVFLLFFLQKKKVPSCFRPVPQTRRQIQYIGCRPSRSALAS